MILNGREGAQDVPSIIKKLDDLFRAKFQTVKRFPAAVLNADANMDKSTKA